MIITPEDIANTVAAKLTGKLRAGAIVRRRGTKLYGRCWNQGGTEAVFVYVGGNTEDHIRRWDLDRIEICLPDDTDVRPATPARTRAPHTD